MDYSYPSREAVRVPAGYHFRPSDDEVLEHFLLRRVLGRPLTPNPIQELDIFRYDPEQLPLDIRERSDGEGPWGYFFVYGKLGDDEGGGDGVRTTPGGYWKVKGIEKDIMDRKKKETIGFIREMVFYRGKAPRGKKTVWVLLEYRLNPTLGQLKNPHDTKVGLTTLIFVFTLGIYKLIVSFIQLFDV
ncbi:NAC domain-containing protein 2 [Cocos nucifera]|uniref:NAC domain-containing protein 2 n=1 Tax=Cocos nucifera TaxID=13894 RepID=A0A8K0IPA3_COCNU|nr:NAC domain-containing protein 2 [Cocos nucifera]